VSGEAIQRNLDDVRAALNYAVGKQLPWAPKVPAVTLALRSPPRDVTLTIDQLGAIVAYAAYDIEALRWVLGMIATAARPDAVLKWNIAEQWKGEPNFDTHPHGEPRTKKRNAVVPLIPEFGPGWRRGATARTRSSGAASAGGGRCAPPWGCRPTSCRKRSATRSQRSSARGRADG
jgi:hypothetical protein